MLALAATGWGAGAMRVGKAATWARWRSDVGVTGVWVAGATLVTYWGLTIVSFLLRAPNDPTTDVADAVLKRLGWGPIRP
jgi:hypothetical protein